MNHGDQSHNQRSQRSQERTGGGDSTNDREKEKKGWFHSLTRRKKSDSVLAVSSSTSGSQNNNNEVCVLEAADSSMASCSNGGTGTLRRRRDKDKRNVFARLRRKVGQGLSSLRNWHSMGDCDDGGTTDATYEFLTPAICTEPTLLFTHDYMRFIRKKWLEREDHLPNQVMYKACSEMLNQVWYWGEISRRDSQRQLSDKPTGSFLVRDSETSGSQFTLSFRIVNVTLHYRLEFRDDFWHFEELKYVSIVEMIEDILHRCTNDNFVCFVKVPNEMQPPFPVILKYPLSRYANMPKLQDLCRRVLQRQMSREQLAQLPVPAQMLEYLSVERELVFQS
ncbi:suppressor of cytokine signaling 4 [Drosophila eugracilis]|uniref:suppressor of cytokine signaling 4 n=1 Tax=Drosophila eugracilis TaxID=29029 RepID=UPI0007E5BDD8|nr:suppressor of cytokine signaling 4 [Drosophila eugracilis]